MPITNKDGTPYKLKKPNPLVEDQVMWNKTDVDLVLHNCKWKGENQQYETELVPHHSDFKPVSNVLVLPPIEEEPEVEKPKIEKPFVKEQILDRTNSTVLEEQPKSQLDYAKINDNNILTFHCLPGTIRDKKDNLYGDSYRTIEYGNKFTFEGVMLERGDLGMKFWARVQLTEGSVVFPSTYRSGAKYGEYRWWKVTDSEPSSGGVIHKAIISNHQPDFG